MRQQTSPTNTMTAPVDDLLNTKLREMSVEERSDGLHDVHGVAENLPEETPKMIRAKVKEMNEALIASTSRSKSSVDTHAYDQAISLDRAYVERLKVPFLRAEGYNSGRAAARLIRFFDRKLELFGEEMLVKEITPRECFDDEEMEALQAGVVQILSHRDRVGRGVFLIHGKVNVNYSTKVVVSQSVQ
jgi:transcriptional regulator of aromatic amino acid metabolism